MFINRHFKRRYIDAEITLVSLMFEMNDGFKFTKPLRGENPWRDALFYIDAARKKAYRLKKNGVCKIYANGEYIDKILI